MLQRADLRWALGSFEAKNVHGQCVGSEGKARYRPAPVHQVVLAMLVLSPFPSVCLFPSLSVLPPSGGLCAAHKDVQRVSPSCASGAMNCLITAATPIPEHPSSVKQNFLSVWSPRLHFHICIFLLLLLLVSFLPVLSHRGRGTHNAPLSG